MDITRRALLTEIVPIVPMTAALTPAHSARAAMTSSPRATVSPQVGGAREFPNFLLSTHEGKAVRFYNDLVKGRIVLFNFMYADCAGVCPAMTANLAKVQELLGTRVGRDVFMYSLTLKPREDTPEALNQYVRMHGIGPGWTFLTGKPADLEFLRRKLGFYDRDPAIDRDVTNHVGIVVYGNEAIDRWAACPAMTTPTEIAKFVGWMDAPKG